MANDFKYGITRRKFDHTEVELIATYRYELDRDYASDELEETGREVEKVDV